MILSNDQEQSLTIQGKRHVQDGAKQLHDSQ